MKTPITAKQLAQQNPVAAAQLAERLTKAAKPQLYCVIIGSAVGNSEFIPITTVNQASAAFRAFCAENGFGARDAGSCKIYAGGKQVGYVSYNGRVWEGREADWKSGATPIFDPSSN